MEEVQDVVTGDAMLGGIIVLVLLLPALIVFGLVCRLLWHAGSWFKRKDRR